jgi:hypothetical protein
MSRLGSVILLAALLLLSAATQSDLSSAETCASKCKSRFIQFKPGQYLRLQVVNHTFNPVKLEKLPEMQRFTLLPGKQWQVIHPGTAENLSLMFWNDRGNAIVAIASKPNLATLRLELRPSREFSGERSLYLLNDGRVELF